MMVDIVFCSSLILRNDLGVEVRRGGVEKGVYVHGGYVWGEEERRRSRGGGVGGNDDQDEWSIVKMGDFRKNFFTH